MGGRTKHFLENWKDITHNKFVLECIQGVKINLCRTPFQTKWPHEIKFSQEEQLAMRSILETLENQQVIRKCSFNQGDFMNNIFLRPKKSAKSAMAYRPILNLKRFNKDFVEFTHFQMQGLKTVLDLVEPGCYMASIDLSNAYHSIPIHTDFTKFLKFKFEDQIYEYLVLPQGYKDSPRIFVKVLKPLLARLRAMGLINCVYLDDFYLQGRSYDSCSDNVTITHNKLVSLGFEISEKSQFEPSQILDHLGFIINSVKMNVSLSEEKRDNILTLINSVLGVPHITIRKFAQVIGTLVASFPAVEYGKLFYRQMECLKIEALSFSNDFESLISLNEKCRSELEWWISEGLYSGKLISHGKVDHIIVTDSSGYAWGAIFNDRHTQGLWDEREREMHINILEMKAGLLGIQSLCSELSNCHLQIQMDNQTAVTYVNNFGGTHSELLNSYARQLILWCKNRNIWVSACHVAGKANKADKLSRVISEHTEWKLDNEVFLELCNVFGKPCIDLFAARHNHQLELYMSFCPDPSAYAIDAFCHLWDNYVYIFSPFNLITRILRKIKEDCTPKVLMIVPFWPVSPWYPVLREMLMPGFKENPMMLKNSRTLLKLPSDHQAVHPLFPKMKLMACILCGTNF